MTVARPGRSALAIIALCFVIAACASLFPDRYWLFETLSNLRVQFAFAGIVLSVALFVSRLRLLAMPTLALGALSATLALAPAPRQAIAAGGTPLRIMSVNINFQHHDTQRLVAIIKAAQPDILVLIEDAPEVRRDIAKRVGNLPYHAETGIDARAVSIDSRFPLVDVRAESTDYVAHILTARLALPTPEGARAILLIAAHPLVPLLAWKAEQRKKALEYMAERAGAAQIPVILAGDLNLTPHSPYFTRLERRGRLRDTASGRAPAPTWLSPVAPFGLRIDHVLVSPEIGVIARRVSPGFGSDHRGLIVDLALPPAVVPAGANF
jgi:endonuclease/exonuclease/phosphatase (EEP) superfamily protein YafD